MVVKAKVSVPKRYEVLLPQTSATIPVGTSKITWPTVKKALAAKAWALDSPAESRNRVLTPQIKEAAKVDSSIRVKYVARTLICSNPTDSQFAPIRHKPEQCSFPENIGF